MRCFQPEMFYLAKLLKNEAILAESCGFSRKFTKLHPPFLIKPKGSSNPEITCCP